MNISDKLNKLIQFDLADGVLIEKEKSILLKNDKEEGIDEDEFEMYLCSLLFEKKQIPKREAVSEMLRPPFVEKLTLNKDRDTKKCPRCGECRHGFEIDHQCLFLNLLKN